MTDSAPSFWCEIEIPNLKLLVENLEANARETVAVLQL
jgi:hypothetical protein